MPGFLDAASAPAWTSPQGLPEAMMHAGRTLTMGVLNVTPDSFSDGGAHNERGDAVAHAEKLIADGADIIDIGGESTRPGGERVTEDEELRRVIPVVRDLAERGIVISVDTMRASVAQESVKAGALIVNDVSAGLADEQMAPVVAAARTSLSAPPVFIGMHWRGHSDVMNAMTDYEDVARDVARELSEQIDRVRDAGVEEGSLVLDPGFGFSKKGRQNWDLLRELAVLEQLGLPLLVGVSRKRFVTALGGDRDAATAAISTLCAARGTWAVRVHDVAATAAGIRVVSALQGRVGEADGFNAHLADGEYPSAHRAAEVAGGADA
ncbi:dihydropteroate synthase [Helcobacillus massiliensis]|uniref:Dihydropteroate synthase n=1 Tax=Helcobacillus massiliensis TaxID=521392 RepID=A0A839QXF9_9MICO|nr:dihydropteroate synthase [Helcobacillus massiliensis]MBB3022661.1 dihydropteroate synthase [Helcobacillus massiliensis]MCT1558254.1 dihydropteroate synthase [Helcobacillus massiliensis]MCT2035507.1 dihydropteroate synthase [Helcobacillus massiliensis]MCT2331998.1 dihydropteroate synthase [Helcobacillus massiliensis]